MYIPRRFLLAMMLFIGASLCFFLRVSLSMAIIVISEEYKWSEETEGLLLSAYFYGYSAMQAFGGYFARKLGGKTAYALALTSGCLIMIAFPFTTWSVPLAFTINLLSGLGHSLIFPAAYHMISNWYPKSEKTTAVAFAGAGSTFGTVLCWSLSSYIIRAWKWPSLFFLAGGFGVIWFLPWFILISEYPEIGSGYFFPISSQESEYIKSGTGKGDKSASTAVPWLKIFSSYNVIILMYCSFANNWAFLLFISWLPTYYETTFDITLEEIGTLSLIPFILYPIVQILSGIIADRIINKKILSHLNTRKVFQILACGIPSSILTTMSFVELDKTQTITMVTVAIACTGFSSGGLLSNTLELTPTFAGSLFGVVNAFACIPGVVGVYITGYILQTYHNDWSPVFLLTSSLLFLSMILWVLFARVEPLDFEKTLYIPQEQEEKKSDEIIVEIDENQEDYLMATKKKVIFPEN